MPLPHFWAVETHYPHCVAPQKGEACSAHWHAPTRYHSSTIMMYIPAAGGVTAAASPPSLRQTLASAAAAAPLFQPPLFQPPLFQPPLLLLLSHVQQPPPPSQLLLRRLRTRLAGSQRGRRETKPRVAVPQTQACHGYCAETLQLS